MIVWAMPSSLGRLTSSKLRLECIEAVRPEHAVPGEPVVQLPERILFASDRPRDGQKGTQKPDAAEKSHYRRLWITY